MKTTEIFKLIRLLGILKNLKMPEEKTAIAEVISLAPKGIETYLKFFAVRQVYRATGALSPISVSVDTTLACNFACPGCYIAADLVIPSKENIERGKSIEDWEQTFADLHLDNPFLIHASWVGGEPTLRTNLLKKGVRHFRSNWIHTNGYLPLPNDIGDTDHEVRYVVSIDGYGGAHDRMRPTRGGRLPTYQRVLQNIRNSDGLDIMVHTVVTPENLGTLPSLIEDLRATGKVRQIGFSILSPQKGSSIFRQEERDTVIEQLLTYRRRYGRFLWSTPSMLKNMRADRSSDTYADGCRIKVKANGTGAMIPLNVHGQVKEQCVMGPEQSCAECGCAIPAQFATMFNNTFRGELENMPIVGRLLDYVTA